MAGAESAPMLEVVRFVSRGDGVSWRTPHRVDTTILELRRRSRHARAPLESTRCMVALEGDNHETSNATSLPLLIQIPLPVPSELELEAELGLGDELELEAELEFEFEFEGESGRSGKCPG